ncbi:MAG: DNA gyrase/topoisomerase IV subunit A, partial [Lutibacter sp.]|nr:DNA gyrase/topoisomerase IV subunit A [Lutibacter sp.]
RLFDDIIATKVVMRNTKLYVNREEGFVGTSLKKDEYVDDCADIDDVIVFRGDGTMLVTKVDAKTFVGKDIIHVAVFRKNDTRTVYNMIYRDGKNGPSYIKRFNVTGVTRDKEYDLTAGNKGSQVLYFTENPNGEAETITINLRAAGSVKKLKWDIDFSDLAIKGRSSRGNIVTKHSIKKIDLKSEGVSTLKPRKIWFDETVQRLNVDKRGELLGEFKPEDRLLIINQKGIIKTIKPELSTHFESDMIVLEKWVPEKPISVIYYDGDKEKYFVKRFMIDNPNKEEVFISEHPKSQLEIVATEYRPMAEVQFSKRNLEPILLNFEEFIAIKGIKAQGNQLTADKIKQVNILEPLPYEPPVIEDVEVNDEEVIDNSTESFDDDSHSENDNLADEAGQIKLF